MKTNPVVAKDFGLTKTVLISGLCGGIAEIVWVHLYASLAGHSSAEVARQVTASLFPAAAGATFAVELGIAIHLALSVLLALGYALLIWIPHLRRRGPAASVATASLVLAAIWAANFLVVLPVLNAKFVHLLPYPVSLGSKILFGLAMAGVLMGAQRRHAPARAGQTTA